MTVFDIDIKKVDEENKWDKLQEFMDKAQDETEKYIEGLAKNLGVTYDCACDVWYLRTRSRWTQELEDELIRLHKQGYRPNMCEFG